MDSVSGEAVIRGGAFLRRYAWFVLAFSVLVVVWGGFVRASLSGDGCGDSWPLCHGKLVPWGAPLKTIVEVVHRQTSGLAFLLVLGLLIATFRTFPRGHIARKGAVGSMVFIVTASLIGAALVIFGWVVDDRSLGRAVVFPFHVMNTFFLLGFLTLTALWIGGVPAPRLKTPDRLGLYALLLLATLVIMGMSGAFSALGGTLSPTRGLTPEILQSQDPVVRAVATLKALHPVIAVIGTLVLLATAAKLVRARPSPRTRRIANALVGLVVVEILLGVMTIVFRASIPLALAHLLVADLMWVAGMMLGAVALASPAEEPTAEAAAARPTVAV